MIISKFFILVFPVVVQLPSPTLCKPMKCSTPGFPVPHYLPEFAQTHVHWIDDAIQPSHPLLPPSPLTLFPSISVFSNELALRIRWPKYWSFSTSPSSEYSGFISFSIECFDLLAVQGTLRSSPAPQLENLNSLELSLLYGPTLTSLHDYWKNHSFDYMNLCLLGSPKYWFLSLSWDISGTLTSVYGSV